MTAGQIATPYRQVRPSLLVAALVVTFGIGLVTGLVAQRTVGQAAQAAGNAGRVAAATGSGTYADTLALHFAKRDLQAAADQVAVRSAISADGQDIRLGVGFGSATVPAAAPAADQVTVRSAITPDGQDIRLGSLAGSAAGQDVKLGTRFGGP